MIIPIGGYYYNTINGDVYVCRPDEVNTSETWKDDHKYSGIYTEPLFVNKLGVIPTLNCNFRCKYCMENSTDGHEDLDPDIVQLQ